MPSKTNSAFGLITQSAHTDVVSHLIYIDGGEELGTEIGTADPSS